MANRREDNKFDSSLAYGLIKPNVNIFEPVSTALKGFGQRELPNR